MEALQPAKLGDGEQTVTISSFTANVIGDKGLLCNVQAVMKRERRNGMSGEIRHVDRLLLVAVTGEGTIVTEDSLLASKAAQAMATN